jgi:PilZ domain
LQNRRKHVRVPMRAQVICIADDRTLRGVTWNISQNGIQVEVPELPRKANVRLTFRLPLSDTMIDASGTVVWVLARKHGIKFKYMGEQSHDSMSHFIDEHQTGDQSD